MLSGTLPEVLRISGASDANSENVEEECHVIAVDSVCVSLYFTELRSFYKKLHIWNFRRLEESVLLNGGSTCMREKTENFSDFSQLPRKTMREALDRSLSLFLALLLSLSENLFRSRAFDQKNP